ncbi:MAG: hypothetical protein ACTSQZ_04980 [Candidatus Thorarchaeota archaeon]
MKSFISLLLIVGLLVAYPVAYYQSKERVTITVEDKGVKRSGESDTYLIYTNKGTFEITDMIFAGYFKSSDDYGKIKVGKTYRCSCYGWRIGAFSMYKNLKSCKEYEMETPEHVNDWSTSN